MSTSRELCPVIIGAGLGGMLISRRLSEEGVPHVLLGKTPDFSGPTLGESMNFVSSIEFDRYFKAYQAFAHPKDWIFLLGNGTSTTGLNFDRFLSSFPAVPAVQWSIGVELPRLRLIHLDRIGFDTALYQDILQSPHLRRVEAGVRRVVHDAETDRITALELDDDTVLEPSCVFDTSNAARLLAKALSIPLKPLSDTRHLVYAHFRGQCGDKVLWQRATNILSLRDPDGVVGLAWAIPLGEYISVGASLTENRPGLAPERVMDRLLERYADRGVDVLDRYPDRRPARAHPHQYYSHERAFGANYLLASGAYAQINFASSTGVTTSMAAAEVAARFSRGDLDAAAQYQRFMDTIVASRVVFDGLEVLGQEDRVDTKLAAAWFRRGMERVNRFYTLKTALRPRIGAGWFNMAVIATSPDWLLGTSRFLDFNQPEHLRHFSRRAEAERLVG